MIMYSKISKEAMMSDKIEFTIHLRSPRHGTNDPYIFNMQRDKLFISGIGLWKVDVKRAEGSDPIWSDDRLLGKNGLLQALANEAIYPPTYFISGIEAAWKAWRDHELDDAGVKTELELLFQWVDAVDNSRPVSPFWRKTF
jgi:hypothetical protein